MAGAIAAGFARNNPLRICCAFLCSLTAVGLELTARASRSTHLLGGGERSVNSILHKLHNIHAPYTCTHTRIHPFTYPNSVFQNCATPAPVLALTGEMWGKVVAGPSWGD